jgi:hypothetical protein
LGEVAAWVASCRSGALSVACWPVARPSVVRSARAAGRPRWIDCLPQPSVGKPQQTTAQAGPRPTANETSLGAFRHRDREVRSGAPVKISDNAYAQLAEAPADLTALATAEFSPALARTSPMGERHRHGNARVRSIYGYNRDRIPVARPLRPGGSGVLLAHRKLCGLSATPRNVQSDTCIAFNDDDR